jgi:hypothetical protein
MKGGVDLQDIAAGMPTAEEVQAEGLLQEVVGNIHRGDLRHPLPPPHGGHHPFYADMYHDQSVLATINAPEGTIGAGRTRGRGRPMTGPLAAPPNLPRTSASATATTTSYIIDNLEQEVSPFLKQRRKRRAWTDVEVENLKAGVSKHGEGNWVQILRDPEFHFDERNKYDLKDKWRNLVAYKPYSSRRIRRYMLLTPDHQPLLSESGHPHYFHNRWPRDAALKVASRSEFYTDGRTEIDIYHREVPTRDVTQGNGQSSAEQYQSNIVHVYRGTRERREAVNIPKFQTKDHMWVPKVVKVREEKFQQGRYTGYI